MTFARLFRQNYSENTILAYFPHQKQGLLCPLLHTSLIGQAGFDMHATNRNSSKGTCHKIVMPERERYHANTRRSQASKLNEPKSRGRETVKGPVGVYGFVHLTRRRWLKWGHTYQTSFLIPGWSTSVTQINIISKTLFVSSHDFISLGRITKVGSDSMDEVPSPEAGGAKQPKTTHHEPIRFGIDQILGGSDQESGRSNSDRSGSESGVEGYRLSSPIGTCAAPYTALSVSLSGITGPLEDLHVYGMNRTLVPRGVIRVPAHRPLAAAVPPPMTSAVPNIGSLCFPWMENNRRFAKDRLPGSKQMILCVISCRSNGTLDF